jgi:pyruvate dehydrogenase E1 component beta subunit
MSRRITYAQALNEALAGELERDQRVFLLGEDIGLYGGVFKVTAGLFQRFGAERVVDTPISEAGFIGAALGAAAMGLRPVVEVMWIDFSLVAADQIINQVAKARYMSGGQLGAPLVIRTQGGGFRGNAAQHSQSLETLYCHIPGLKVVMPSTPADAKGLLTAAIRDDDPVLVIEHKMLYPTSGEVPDGDHLVPLGRAVIRRPGRDVTIVSWSRMACFALEAADLLAAEGIEAEVIDARSLVPFDHATLAASVARTNRLVVAHEAHLAYGPGAEIAAWVQEHCFDDLDAPVVRLGAREVPIPFSRPLEAKVLPDAQRIAAAARRLCGRPASVSAASPPR